MPEAAPATTVAPAAPPVDPATTAAPVEIPSSPGAAPKPTSQARAPQKVLVKTRVPTRAFSAALSAAPSAAAPATQATPAEPAAAEPAVESTEAAGAPTDSSDAASDSAADSATAAEPAKPGAVPLPGAEPAKTIDESELVKRVAKLNRREAKLEKDLGIASELRTLVGPEHATRETVRAVVQRVRMLEQGREAALADPAGFLERLYGIPRAHTSEKTVSTLIGDAGKTPEQKAKEQADAEMAASRGRIAAYEKELADAAQKQKVSATEQQVRSYISGTIEPLIADKDSYKFLRAELGNRAAQEIYNRQVKHFEKTGKAPAPKEVADYWEKRYREDAARKAALLGASVTPKQPASPSRTEPLPEKRPAPQTRAPQPNPALTRGARKAYTVKVV